MTEFDTEKRRQILNTKLLMELFKDEPEKIISVPDDPVGTTVERPDKDSVEVDPFNPDSEHYFRMITE